MMKPILFNTDMVRAILDGRKTVTRRAVKPQPVWIEQDTKYRACPSGWWWGEDCIKAIEDKQLFAQMLLLEATPYRPGDILYVRETWSTRKSNECYAQPCHTGICPHKSCELADGSCFPYEYIYKATDSLPAYGGKWRPSIHMPREAARIFLRVTDVRVERLQEITDDDIQREGVHGDPYTFAASEFYDRPELKDNYSKAQFAGLWNNTIKPADRERYGWAANPWVWVIEFERCEKPEEG